MLQLKHGGKDPSIRVPGTLDALTALEKGGYFSFDDAEYFRGSYRFQRSIEARIRLMDAAGRHELPESERELAKLAYLLGYTRPQELVDEAQHKFAENRARFNRIFDAAELVSVRAPGYLSVEHGSQGAIKIGPQVLDVLDADRQAAEGRADEGGVPGVPCAPLDQRLDTA